MEHLQIVLLSNSNKQLDALSKEMIHAIRCSGAVKAGPIPSKGQRIIHCYNTKHNTIHNLMKINEKKYNRVYVTINLLASPQ